MGNQTYNQLLAYYAGLLIAQYLNKPNASATIEQLCSGILMPDGEGSTLPLDVLNGFNLNATVQTVSFSAVPDSGSFAFSYLGTQSPTLSFSASQDNVLAALNVLLGTGTATPQGTPEDQSIVVTFNTIIAPQLLSVVNNTLMSSGSAVIATVTTNVAIGQQLDWLGLYNGVTRSGIGINGQAITLDDAQFLQLIQIAISSNHLGSSLADIQDFIATYFPNGAILVFDYANTTPMQMSYLISSTAINENVIQLAVADGLLPVPMAVGVSYIVAPVVNEFFSPSDYYINGGAQFANTTPLNCFAGYSSGNINPDSLIVDYADAF